MVIQGNFEKMVTFVSSTIRERGSTMKLSRIFFVAALFAVVLTVTSGAFAAADYYLKISDIKGEQSRVIRCADGSCAIKDIGPGSFAAVVCDAQGKALSSGRFALVMTFKASAVRESPSKASLLRESPTRASSGRESPTKASSGGAGKVAGATDGASSVVSPRDAASGLPTGRRQHQPLVITKEWDAASPQGRQIDTPTGGDSDQVSMWELEVRVDRIEMK